MILIILTISILYIMMLAIIVKAYLKDHEDIEDRCLQLEKRIEEYRKTNNSYNEVYKSAFNDLFDEVEKLKRKRK